MEEQLRAAFSACGYEEKFAKVVLSNRPDLCEYQCNGAMAAAKAYHKKPIDIANAVVEQLGDGDGKFSAVQAVMPGFINLKLSAQFIADYMKGMAAGEKLGVEAPKAPETIIVDYGAKLAEMCIRDRHQVVEDAPELPQPVLHRRPGEREAGAGVHRLHRLGALGRGVFDVLGLVDDLEAEVQAAVELDVPLEQVVGCLLYTSRCV